MPTPLSHSFCGFIFFPDAQKHVHKNKIYSAAFIILISILSDFDYFWGMQSGDLKANHRLLTHSLFFPLLVGVIFGIIAKLFKRKISPVFILAILLVGIHIFLDYLSFDNYPQNGIGVALFWPLMNKFFIFPFHPIANRFVEGPYELLFIIINDFYFMIIFSVIGLTTYRKIHKEKVCVSES